MWLDLRLTGIDPESLNPHLKGLLLDHMAQKRDQRFLETMLLTRAMLVASGRNDTKLPDLIREYAALTFPGLENERENMGEKVAKLMEKELAKGPLKVQSREYTRKGRRKSR